jgi:hypothetical protein
MLFSFSFRPRFESARLDVQRWRETRRKRIVHLFSGQALQNRAGADQFSGEV